MDKRKLPAIFHHAFNSESKSVTFGWAVFIAATYGAIFAREPDGARVLPAADYWWYVIISAALVATKVFKEVAGDVMAAKFGGKPATPAMETPK